MTFTVYAPLSEQEAEQVHKMIAAGCAVHMTQNEGVDEKGKRHTFFSLHTPILDDEVAATIRVAPIPVNGEVTHG